MSISFALSAEEGVLYGALWQQAEVEGVVDAEAAVELLSQSGLDEADLYQIWELCDPEENGYLEEQSFYTSLKLVALVQAGHEADFANIGLATSLVDLGESTDEVISALETSTQETPTSAPDVPAPASPEGDSAADPPAVPAPAGGGADQADPWVVAADDRSKFERIFETLGPKQGVLSGRKARQVLLKSKLPQDVLGRIWEVSDIDQDGNLDKHEFVVAMNFVAKCLEGLNPPDSLPKSLQKPAAAAAPDAVPPASTATPQPAAAQPPAQHQPPPTTTRPSREAEHAPPAVASKPKPSAPTAASAQDAPAWVVTPKDKRMYDKFFKTADKQGRGVVNGVSVMKIFQKSQLSSDVLAQIWELVDINKTGEINDEQFALAMHLISSLKTKKDFALPNELTAGMIPPSFRTPLPPTHTQSTAEPAAVPAAVADPPPQVAAPEPPTPTPPSPAATTFTPPVFSTTQPTAPASAEAGEAEAQMRAQINDQKVVNAALETEALMQREDIDRETADLAILKMELRDLKADESRLRLEIKNGKQQLQGVLAAMRSQKNNMAKQRTKVDKLQTMKEKTVEGLNKTSEKAEALRASEVDEGLSAASDAINSSGMTFQDYFGNE